MRVVCAQLPLRPDGEPFERHPWLTMHAEYDVVSVRAVPDSYVHLQIVTDDGRSLGLYDSKYFTTVDSTIPGSWTVQIDERGVLELAPAAWHAPGFWEAYYNDDDPSAIEAVETELRRLRPGSGAGSDEDALSD